MEMTRTPSHRRDRHRSAIAGVIGVPLAPDKLWLVTLLEGLALASLIWALANSF